MRTARGFSEEAHWLPSRGSAPTLARVARSPHTAREVRASEGWIRPHGAPSPSNRSQQGETEAAGSTSPSQARPQPLDLAAGCREDPNTASLVPSRSGPAGTPDLGRTGPSPVSSVPQPAPGSQPAPARRGGDAAARNLLRKEKRRRGHVVAPAVPAAKIELSRSGLEGDGFPLSSPSRPRP